MGGDARVGGAVLGFVVLYCAIGGDLHGPNHFGDDHAVVEVHVGAVEVDGLVAAGLEDYSYQLTTLVP